MAKQLIFAEEARQKLLKGAEIISKAVVTTLGPKGRNVALDRKWGAPNVVHDGVTVAKEVELEDPFENMGAQLVREAASKTNDDTGDGTTTATLLAASIIADGLKNVTAGANPMVLRKGIEKAMTVVVKELSKMARKVVGREEITQVATIAAADPDIGIRIAESLEKVGKDGVVTVEEGKGLEMEIDYKEGMEFDQGYVSPYFVTNPERMEAEVENPFIIITDQKISAVSDFLPSLEKIVKVSKNIVIIAEDIEGEALATLVVNKLRGTFNTLAVKAPGFGDRRKSMLEDIAILTGGTVISEDTGRKLDSVTVEDCGRAEKVWANNENTQIIGGKGSAKAIKARITQIRKAIKEATSEFDKEKLEERLAKLAGGVAVIRVGAATEVELKEKQERVKDAVGATKAAVEEGIVPGGGVALIRAAQVLDDLKIEGDEKVGVEILKSALYKPAWMIVQNTGVEAGWAIKKIEEGKGDYGFDAYVSDFGSMYKKGIVDPVKVTKSALQNAVSVAIMCLTTEAMIADLPEKEEKTPPVPPGAGY
jgi:chaperonin GroEL